MSRRWSMAVIGLLGMAGIAAAPTAAEEAQGASAPRSEVDAGEALALRGIMQDLGREMQVITGAISQENWARVAEVAPRVADHPQPPLFEKMRILSFIGSDVGRFRDYDEQVNQAARTLGEAARREDGPAVIDAFAELQGSCLGCHRSFREPFQAHFYGE